MKKTLGTIVAIFIAVFCFGNSTASAYDSKAETLAYEMPTPPASLPIGSLASLTAYAHERVVGISGGIYGNILYSNQNNVWVWSRDVTGNTSEGQFLINFEETQFSFDLIDPSRSSRALCTLMDADYNTLFEGYDAPVNYVYNPKTGMYQINSAPVVMNLVKFVPIRAANKDFMATDAHLIDVSGNWMANLTTDENGTILFPSDLADNGYSLVVGYTNLSTGVWKQYVYQGGTLSPTYTAGGRQQAFTSNYTEQSDEYVGTGIMYAWCGGGIAPGDGVTSPVTRLTIYKAGGRMVRISSGIYDLTGLVEMPKVIWFHRLGANVEEAIDLVNGQADIYLAPGTYIMYPENHTFDQVDDFSWYDGGKG